MFEAIKTLVESGVLNSDTQQALQEAWDNKLVEAREQVRAELREEFARKYAADKSVMVEALDRMVTENLQREISEFAEDRDALRKDRVELGRKIAEAAEATARFLATQLKQEIVELREDRKRYTNNVKMLESFVQDRLFEEIKEFSQDKRALVEAKVKLVTEAKTQLNRVKTQFVAKSARLVKESVANHLNAELTQLKEDVQLARENMFGRRLFEAFATEFAATHLNENKEIAKLNHQLAESQQQLAQRKQLVETAQRDLKIITERTQRQQVMGELLAPLSKERAAVMVQMLESVQTPRLRQAFDKYLPAVLDAKTEVAQKAAATSRVQLSEGAEKIEITGDKPAKPAQDVNNIVEIKRLAGLR
jgi:DNA repair exonuclease SbcCD ATPase subunit